VRLLQNTELCILRISRELKSRSMRSSDSMKDIFYFSMNYAMGCIKEGLAPQDRKECI